ncbi:FAD-dependent oxidoreductase [Cupriavidus basilensis]
MSTAHSATPFDVIVIGCGISGLSAAVAAAGKGATVAVLERATRDEFGGNTRWTEAYFRMKSDMEVSDDFDELLCANAGDNLDPNVIRSMADAYENWPPYVKAHGMPDPELLSTRVLPGRTDRAVAQELRHPLRCIAHVLPDSRGAALDARRRRPRHDRGTARACHRPRRQVLLRDHRQPPDAA